MSQDESDSMALLPESSDAQGRFASLDVLQQTPGDASVKASLPFIEFVLKPSAQGAFKTTPVLKQDSSWAGIEF